MRARAVKGKLGEGPIGSFPSRRKGLKNTACSRAPCCDTSQRSSLHEVPPHQRRQGLLSALLERIGDELHLAPSTVLREFPARLEPRDRNLEVDDGGEHALDVAGIQVVEFR